jgi:hypothetical protein
VVTRPTVAAPNPSATGMGQLPRQRQRVCLTAATLAGHDRDHDGHQQHDRGGEMQGASDGKRQ